MKNGGLVSIVIPVFNEAASLDELIRRCLAACRGVIPRFEVLLVDDGSSDGSTEMITAASRQYPGEIIGVILNRNYGQHAAVLAGFEKSRGDIVVTLDADLQNPPEEIPRLVEKIREGNDVVGSIRQNRQDSVFRKVASASVNRVVREYTGVHMHDYGCMLRAYRRPIIDAMLSCHEHSTFIPVLANSFAGKTAEIEVGHSARAEGESKYSLWKLINLQFDLLTSMSTLPLRILSVVGVMISAMGIGFGLFLFVMRLVHGPGWAAEGVFTLFAVLFIFIGFQFVGMGLLGEYIGRMYHDVRNRPRYFVSRVADAGPPRAPAAPADRGEGAGEATKITPAEG